MAMWKIWNCQTHKSLEITNAIHVTSQTLYTRRSLMQSMSHLFLARCMYVCTLRMLMKNTVQLVQQVHIHRCLIVIQCNHHCQQCKSMCSGELVVFFSYELSLT